MVDEVLAVIRRLVNRGLTCVIVTHEMNFARTISPKIIYMDEKGIYEMARRRRYSTRRSGKRPEPS